MARFIDYEPGVSSESSEPMRAAWLGMWENQVNGTIHDDKMKSWLQLFPGVVQNSSVGLTHFLEGWAMMHGVSDEAKTWVDGSVAQIGNFERNTRPLTVSFGLRNCGKVLFSSYHTAGHDFPGMDAKGFLDFLGSLPLFGGGPGGGPADMVETFPEFCASSFSAQDRILEYLVFEISSCVAKVL